MIVLELIVVAMVVASVVLSLTPRGAKQRVTAGLAHRPRRRPQELRGDWWAEFERQFREYERRQAGRDRWRPRVDGHSPRDDHGATSA